MSRVWLIATLLALFSVAASGADVPTQGFATQYGGRQDRSDPNTPIYGLIDGACGYGAIPKASWPYWQVAALGFSNAVSSSGSPQKWGCGACLQVTCTGAGCASTDPFVVLVTDTCKSCAASQVNINALTYEKFISKTNGQMAVTWQKVPCAPPGNIIARVTAASGSYIRLVLLQVGGSDGVKSVEFRKGSGSWIKMDQAWGANWQSSSFPGAPADLRITPNDGSAPFVATGAISAAAPGDYDTGVQLDFPAGLSAAAANATAANVTAAAPEAAGNATAMYLGPPVGPQQIPAVATANATAAPANATAAAAMPAATAANATAAVPVASAVNATAVPAVAAATPAATVPAPTNFTTLTLPGTGAAQSTQGAKPVGQPAAAVPAAAVPVPAAAALPAAKAAVPAAATPASGAVGAFSVPAVAAPAKATPPVAVPTPVRATPVTAPAQATPASVPVQATPVSAPVQATPPVTMAAPIPAAPVAAAPPVTVPAPVQATPPSPTAAIPPPAAATPAAVSTSTAALGSSSASPPQAAAISSGAPAPVATAIGSTNQPFSLNLDRTAANVTGGSAYAPSVDSAVQQILNPTVTYNSGGR